MYETIIDWKEGTSTKKKEEHLLRFLEREGLDSGHNRTIIDEECFDEDNIPFGNVDVDKLFRAIDLDVDAFEEFLRSL